MAEKDAPYFSHDSNARDDTKMKGLLSVYKSEGYGYYWIIVENLRNQTNFKLPINNYTLDDLAKQMQCRRIKAEKFLMDCITEFKDEEGRGLFESDGTCFWSNSLNRRMQKYAEKKELAKKAAAARWGKNDAPA